MFGNSQNKFFAYIVIFVTSLTLLFMSILNLCQDIPLQSSFYLKLFNKVRWFSLLINILQVLCFIGYIIDGGRPIVILSWFIFIPIATLSILIISLEISQHYLRLNSRVSFDSKNTFNILKRICYILWFISMIVKLISTILYEFDVSIFEENVHLMWLYNSIYSIIFLIPLGITIYILVKSRFKIKGIFNQLIITKLSRSKIKTINKTIKKLNILILLLFIMFSFFVFNSVFSLISYQNRNDNNLYFIMGTRQAFDNIEDEFIAFLYFPIWTVININILYFTWIPTKDDKDILNDIKQNIDKNKGAQNGHELITEDERFQGGCEGTKDTLYIMIEKKHRNSYQSMNTSKTRKKGSVTEFQQTLSKVELMESQNHG